MLLLLLAAVGIPVMALAFFTILEGALSTFGVWDILLRTGKDLCNVSIGIVGGLFLNGRLQTRVGEGAPVIAIGLVMLDLILAALVILVSERLTSLARNIRGYMSVFIGLVAVAIPSAMILWFGGR
jgi:hypothetical protein